MKKCPKALTLVLMTSLAFGATGCSSEQQQEEDFRVFKSVKECTSSNAYSPQACEEMFVATVKETPRFATLQACEETFGAGACGDSAAALESIKGISDIPLEQMAQTMIPGAQNATAPAAAVGETPRQGGMFMPIMMGYMMGRFMGGGSAMQGSQGLYRDSKTPGSYRTPAGDSIKPDSSGRVKNPGSSIRKGFASTAKPAAIRAGAGSRGGFGGNSNFGGSAGS